MHMITADCITADPYALWQASNGAARCDRMAAVITAADCERNRTQIDADCRCSGCGGLDNQQMFDAATPPSTTIDDAQEFAFVDQDPEENDPCEDLVDFDVDFDDEALLALFPELDEDPWPEYSRVREYQEEAPRRAVYRGRCVKCGGYMENTREHQDDNVFHCLACSWRTSPEYERNRKIHAAWGMI